MEPLRTLALDHQQWKSHADVVEEYSDYPSTYLQPLSKPSRSLFPRDASALASAMASSVELGPESELRAFTYSQLEELEQQALIFKYMVSGVPVPLHLVLPIWKNAVSSPTGVHNNLHPSLSAAGGLCFDFRNSMEPEPGRCRRTDGKKWRCSKEVVPDRKYCEKHMNRGRNRSRKPVERQPLPEPSKPIASSATTSSSKPVINTTISGSSSRRLISAVAAASSGGVDLMSNLISTGTDANTTASVSSSPVRWEFSPSSVLPKAYYGRSTSDSSTGSNSKIEFII